MGQTTSSAVTASILLTTLLAPETSTVTSTLLASSSTLTVSPETASPTYTSSNSSLALFANKNSPPAYTFRPGAQDNVAVYYGQSPSTKSGGLSTLCANPNVDIVILAFVNDFFHADGYPGVNFGPACDPPNAAQQVNAPGLLSCPNLGREVQSCQKIGKPVLVSLGGWRANTSFVSDAQATQFAGTLWNLFGAGKQTPLLRPFGPDVVVDGFDIDNEDHSAAHYQAFATALRAQFAKDEVKKYYLSAAPQCPIPDESIPMSVMTQADFVWVQFYNNPSCNLNSVGFNSSFEQWSSMLAGSSYGQKPRVYIGTGAFAGAGSGYVAGNALRQYVGQATSQGVGNMGGIMLWDGDSALANVDQYERNYLQYAKAALR
ncbi:hypothetical protein LTR86_007024 [Recurvomyces mirabilis]|nr:hypothetical protein LTR86_007024 [Recurvomyces mirabilis]